MDEIISVYFREAKLDDCRFVFDLRNKEYVRKVSWNKKKLVYKNHERWFKDNYKFYWIIEPGRIGFIRLKDDEVSIALLKEYHNKGVGSFVVDKFCKENIEGDVKAEIQIDNVQSLYCFLNAGFKPIGFIMKKNKK